MKKGILGIFFVLFFLLPEFLLGQQYTFHYFGQADGLHSMRQTNMVKDKQGYIWIGSHDGLRRYDGRRFITLGSGTTTDIKLPFNDAGKIFLLPNDRIAMLENNKNIGILNPKTFSYHVLDLSSYTRDNNRIITANQVGDSLLYIYIQTPTGVSVLSYNGNQIKKIFHKSQVNRKLQAPGYRYQKPIYLVPYNQKNDLYFDWELGYFWLNKITKKLTRLKLPDSIARVHPMPDFMIRDAKGRWLISFDIIHGIYSFDSLQKIVPDTHFSNQVRYRYVSRTNGGRLLFSAYDKKSLFIDLYDSKNQEVKRIKNIRFDPWNIMQAWSDNIEHYLYISGNAGFIYGETKDFQLTDFLRKAPNNSTGISVRGMIKMAPNKILITAERTGTYLFNPEKNSCQPLKTPDSWPKDLKPITFAKNLISNHKGKIYISAYAHTPPKVEPEGYLIVFDTIHGFETYHRLPFRIENMILESDTSILAAKRSDLYRIGLIPDIHVTKLRLGKQIKNIKTFFIEKMIHTNKGIILASNQGLFLLKKSNGGLKKILIRGSETDNFFDIYIDKKGLYWIGTNGGGLYRYNPVSKELKVFGNTSGFGSNIIVGILPKDSTYLWVSTYHGVYLFNKRTQIARLMMYQNKKELDEFNRYSYLKINNRNWLIGGMNGFVHIRQLSNSLVLDKPKVMLSTATFRLVGKKTDTTVYTPWQIPIVLPASDRGLALTFGCLEPHFNAEPSCYYRLMPLEKKWMKLPISKELAMNYLPPGKFNLQLTFTDKKNPKQIPFKSQYYFYEHWWFRIGVVLFLLIVAVYLVYIFFDRRLAREKARQLSENENFRHRLFTYIVHEFKTPLTVITGVSGKLKHADLEGKWKETVDNLQRQSEQMNELVEQMLELNQIDAGSWTPELTTVDIPVVIGRICAQFQSLADDMGIKLVCSSSTQSSFQLTDVSKLRSILNNLITNALKYSPKNATVGLSFDATGNAWSVTVRDQGPGISEGDMVHIFELFYKGKESAEKRMSHSGVGLAYVKTAVEALEGRMEVHNDGGAVFKIIFPVKETDVQPENDSLEQSVSREESDGKERTGRAAILLVEDSEEIAKYVQLCFKAEKFKVQWKKNGREGLEYATASIPDLIITDARMPEMNGFELIQKLKKEEMTSHIPIIMLTALSGESNRLKGLEAGADAYVSKPFNERELILTVDNILNTIEKQKSLLAHMLTGQNEKPEEIQGEKETNTSDFIQRVNQCLEANYANSSFGIVGMADQLQMSRIQLNRKLNSIAGLNPSDMLRKYRLNRAAKMLSDKSLSISEITYACGFSDSSYFSKLFAREFGQSPTVYRKNITKHADL